MPDLNLGPAPTRTSSVSLAIAASILASMAAAVFLFNPRKTADIAISGVQTYAPRTEMAAPAGSGGMHVIGTTAHVDNDLFVVLHVKLTDHLRLPLFIKDETAILTSPDGSVLTASAIQKPDLPNLLLSFPALAPLVATPLARDTRVDPKQTVEGTVVLHFPGFTEDVWRNRKSAALTLEFFHQSPQTITIP